jgi:hypothetical protein
MQSLDTKIRRALAFVRAAIAKPAPRALARANAQAADLLEDVDPWALSPEQRRELDELAGALRNLRRVVDATPATAIRLDS